MIDDQLRRIQRTLRELVDFSRPATTQASLCDVHELIAEALNIAKYYKRKKGKRIITQYATSLPKIRVVRDPLVQVFLNLILNAMDATEEGGTIEITTGAEPGCLRVSIRDDGRGIAEPDRVKLFQPYFTTKETGTGLGLFVCRRIMEQTGSGRIELLRCDERGTTFCVWINSDAVGESSAAHREREVPAEPSVPAVCGSAGASPSHVSNLRSETSAAVERGEAEVPLLVLER
jgi:signal transduction histidine kinase